MKLSDAVFDLPAEWQIRDDPREAIFNDKRDGIWTAAQALQLIEELSASGLLPDTSGSAWWRDFVRELIREAQADG